MPVDRLTAEVFADQIAEGVNTRDATLDTRVGSVRDLFIDPVSEVLENQNERVVYLNKLLSLKNANSLVPDDVDDIVFNENMVRWGGSSAITTVSFARDTPPIADITVPINFPVATGVNPVNGVSVVFRTIETKTMYGPLSVPSSQYYNADTGKYELDVQVSSITQNTSAQVGAYTITQFRRPFSDFSSVYNKTATTSGTGIETNAELAIRHSLHIAGSQLSTPTGIKSAILDNVSSVEDAYVVYGGDAYLTRDLEDAGAIDIWILGESPLSRTYVTVYNGTYTLNAVDFQPVMYIDSVSSFATGITYTKTIDYEVVTGIGEYAYSNQAQDGIRWLPGGSHPDIGEDVVIVYRYNALMNILDAYFKQPQFYAMGSDRLFRWAQPLTIIIDANLKVRSGSPTQVLNTVRNAVYEYINALKLGENLEEFDIDSVVSKIYGVDNWTYNQLSIEDVTGVSDIEVDPNLYARILLSNFVINLV